MPTSPVKKYVVSATRQVSITVTVEAADAACALAKARASVSKIDEKHPERWENALFTNDPEFAVEEESPT